MSSLLFPSVSPILPPTMHVARLPLIPLLQIVDRLSVTDMIHLSFCSRKMSKLVQTSKRFRSDSVISFEKDEKQLEICVASDRESIILRSYSAQQDKKLILKATSNFRGFNMSMFYCELSKKQSTVIYYDTKKELVTLFKVITAHLIDLHVTPPKSYLTVAPDDVINNSILKCGRKWDRVTIWSEDRWKNLSSEGMLALLNNTKGIEELRTERWIGNNLPEYSEGFKLNKIWLHCSDWVHHEAIINSQSTSIVLKGWTKPKASMLISIAKLWSAKKKMANLKELILTWGYDLNLDREVHFAFTRKVSRVLGLTDNDRYQMATGEVCRVDGVKAKVTVSFYKFYLRV